MQASTITHRLPTPLLAACVLALSATALQAAPPAKREGTLGSGKASGPIMSMAELRACVAQQARLKTQNDEAGKTQQQITAERAEIERNGAALKAEMPKLDQNDKPALEDYVQRSRAHDQRIEAYQASVAAFNAQVDALGTERAAYAKACENRRYLEDDLKDIKAGK